jgi:outer membrane protein assembly factor BamB
MSEVAPPVSADGLPPAAQPESAAAPVTTAVAPANGRPRLWPGVVIVLVQWLLIIGPDYVVPGSMIQFQAKILSAAGAMLAIAVWWLFGSRVPRRDRLLVVGACAAAGVVALSLSSFPFLVLLVFALPWVPTVWVACLLVTPAFRWPARRAALLLALAATWGYFTLLRFEGIDGATAPEFRWRWTRTSEQKLLDDIASRTPVPAAAGTDGAALTPRPGDWPGFRGAARDGRLAGVQIATDWRQSPPREVWRHRVGPGWSSFAVVGRYAYTQEQRGDSEAVVCYDADTGGEVWSHLDAGRYSDPPSGAGPRATPTFHDGKVYAVGATGRLDCLDARTGRLVWQRDTRTESGAEMPKFGYASSPLVAQEQVIVFASGPQDKGVAAYHASSGEPAWSAGGGQVSYCSPQPARLGGVEQVLLTTETGLTALDPAGGALLWRHAWPETSVAPRVVQPAVLDGGDVLIGTGSSGGTRRVHVSRDGENWAEREVWTSRALKPFFNDMVVHRGHVYGFDGNFFTCVRLDDGKGTWRVRDYDSGQVLLLADQDLLLILSEKGAVALVEANPQRHKELGRFQALEGKTWNHPVVAHGKLFVRNGEEAACYELATTGKRP